MKEIEARSFEDGALLKVNGFDFIGAALDGARVTLRFRDPKGRGAAILAQAATVGVEVNSLQLFDALRWSKNRVFDCRRASGAER